MMLSLLFGLIVGFALGLTGGGSVFAVPLLVYGLGKSVHEAVVTSLAAVGTTGLLSELFGVGGGFLIVPALVLIASLPMRRAVATSLWAITIISALGFASHVLAGARLNLELTAGFVGGGLAGMALGILVGRRLAGPTLQKLFAGMIAAVATFMLVKLVVR